MLNAMSSVSCNVLPINQDGNGYLDRDVVDIIRNLFSRAVRVVGLERKGL